MEIPIIEYTIHKPEDGIEHLIANQEGELPHAVVGIVTNRVYYNPETQEKPEKAFKIGVLGPTHIMVQVDQPFLNMDEQKLWTWKEKEHKIINYLKRENLSI